MRILFSHIIYSFILYLALSFSYSGFGLLQWGKHIPPRKYRFLNTFPENNPDDKENILPVVIIRDPARWLRNMVGAFRSGRCS